MNIQYVTLKPGCVLLCKKYNWFKRFWAKLSKKVLPYNHFVIFKDSCDLVNAYSKNTDVIIAEPKKNYSKKEISTLEKILEFNGDIATSLEEGIKIEDLFAAINVIRTNTFSDNTNDLQAFLNSKYYNIRELSNEKNWNEYIF